MSQLPPLHVHDQVGSTNDLALAAAREGAPHGSCWAADRQSAGRGRREVGGARRLWYSPPGANIHASLLLRPEIAPDRAASLTLAAAVGAHEAISAVAPVPGLWIKWPNDLYVGEAKVAGILTEGVMLGASLEGVVVGIGVNVNVPRAGLPEELRPFATSLTEATGQIWDRWRLLTELRSRILARAEQLVTEGLPAILEPLRRHDRSAGRPVEVQRPDGWLEGTALGVDERGQLRVRAADSGDEISVRAGEVRFVELAPPRPTDPEEE